MSGEYGWLIEAPVAMYLSVITIGNADGVSRYFQWSDDHNKALRFHTKKQAEDVMFAIRTMDRDLGKGDLFAFDRTLAPARAVQHAWMIFDDHCAEQKP